MMCAEGGWMLRLHVLQAEHGDCMILEYGKSTDPRFILVDGGPKDVYDEHLKGELERIRDGGGRLGLVILSHVDNDHVIGLLDLIAELREQRANGDPETIAINSLWHNSFSKTIGEGTDLEARLRTLMATAGMGVQTKAISSMALDGISQGNQLSLAAAAHGILLNPQCLGGVVCVEQLPNDIILENLSLRAVGPTRENIEALKREWMEWLEEQETGAATADPFFASMSDDSFKNLSSIMVLAEADGRKVLLTGDGRGDHLIQGLGKADLLDDDGCLHVDILKVPHHGSDRNVTKGFFNTITADTYVLSGNGKHGNPDLATLIWIVEAAKEQSRAIEIITTNETLSTKKLVEEYPPEEYGYSLKKLEEGDHTVTLEIAQPA